MSHLLTPEIISISDFDLKDCREGWVLALLISSTNCWDPALFPLQRAEIWFLSQGISRTHSRREAHQVRLTSTPSFQEMCPFLLPTLSRAYTIYKSSKTYLFLLRTLALQPSVDEHKLPSWANVVRVGVQGIQPHSLRFACICIWPTEQLPEPIRAGLAQWLGLG